MEFHVYLAFVIATTIMIVLPGPSVLLTVAHSISFGWQHALSTVAGATMGIAVQLIIAAIGLTSLLNVVAEAFEWLRWAGAAYLVYLGIKQWQSAGIPLEVDTSSDEGTLDRGYRIDPAQGTGAVHGPDLSRVRPWMGGPAAGRPHGRVPGTPDAEPQGSHRSLRHRPAAGHADPDEIAGGLRLGQTGTHRSAQLQGSPARHDVVGPGRPDDQPFSGRRPGPRLQGHADMAGIYIQGLLLFLLIAIQLNVFLAFST
jgi:hypothetical protein